MMTVDDAFAHLLVLPSCPNAAPASVQVEMYRAVRDWKASLSTSPDAGFIDAETSLALLEKQRQDNRKDLAAFGLDPAMADDLYAAQLAAFQHPAS